MNLSIQIDAGETQIPSPECGTLLSLPGRDPALPVLYTVASHSLVQKPHGTIYIGLLNQSPEAMENLFQEAANKELYNTQQQLDAKGM